MATLRSLRWPITALVIALIIIIIDLPTSSKMWAPGFLRNASLHFGLDLAGGTQLDFRISEREITEQIEQFKKEIEEAKEQGASSDTIAQMQQQLSSVEDQKRNLVEAIRTVLERRINALGVSEAVITPSYIGNEKHLFVECPGVVDTQECINTVGKTIQLEFKEEETEPTEEYEAEVRDRVATVKKRMTQSGDSLALVGQDMSSELGVAFVDERLYFRDNLPTGLEDLWTRSPSAGITERNGSITVPQQTADGGVENQEVPGIFLAEVTRARTQTGRVINDAPTAFEILERQETGLRYKTHETKELNESTPVAIATALKAMQAGQLQTVNLENESHILFLRTYQAGREQVSASHILIAYQGASASDEGVTRTQEEALAFTKDLKKQIEEGASFESLARQHSDGPSGAEGGSLGIFGRGQMVPAFEAVSFAQAPGVISEPVETPFGYHLIRVDEAPSLSNDTAGYEELIISGENPSDRAASIVSQLQAGEVTVTEEVAFLRTLFFSLVPTGWKDTALDGKHFRTATVTLEPTTNLPIVQITFDSEGATLFQELTRNNINKRIAIFVGGQLVSAPVVQQEISGGTAIITGSNNFEEARQLATDLNTGAIPAPIYLSGQRTVEATLGAEALRTSLQAALIGILILMVYMILVYRLLGLLADIALSIYAAIFFALLKLPLFLFSDQYIVLTLAGMAGIILSIGMAVDANVLIFERLKEELRKGKLFKTAAETGFQRAWPSIRDGNTSTLITCSILFLIGTSIVRGFAITLGMGVLLSMFSAIVVTRWLIRRIADSPLAENSAAFGVRIKNEE